MPIEPSATSPAPGYWDEVARTWTTGADEPAWRSLSDAVNLAVIRDWLPCGQGGRLLKTDLFDEVSAAGLVPALVPAFDYVAGIDVSPTLVATAQARCPGLHAQVADVRRLPFRNASFDHVLSNSTLDHFADPDDIGRALGEIHRVIRPGGTLLVTLDNPANPVVAVRNWLPERLRAIGGIGAFTIGATYGLGRLRRELTGIGFDVERFGTLYHAPRIVVSIGAGLLPLRSEAARRRYLAFWQGFEILSALPTRHLTGYFVAALARKR